jgi:multidrug efflux system membrane fusion protein
MNQYSAGGFNDTPAETSPQPQKRRRGFRWGMLIPVVILAAVLAWLAFGQKKKEAPRARGAIAVAMAKVTPADVPLSVTAIGQAQAWQSVLVKAQVSGKLLRLPVKEGADIKAGDLIAEIDPVIYQAQLTQAQGVLAKDKAVLANEQADLTRYRQLVSQDSIARQQADTQEALVKQTEGVIQQDQGAVALAQANLTYTRITAPISGRVGVRLVDAGNLIIANDTTGIVSINQVSPIAVTFTVPQGDFQRLSQVSNGFRRPLITQAFSQETNAPVGTGALTIADNHIDPATATVGLKARFENGGKQLWPGQFVNVILTLETLKDALTIPSAAVNEGPNGPFAFVVDANGKATQRPITLITTQGATAVVKSGLKAGENVVVDGQLSLKNGSQVRQGPGRGGPSGGKPAGPGRPGQAKPEKKPAA